MATAGASILAGRCGWHILATPLLLLATAQAIWIAAAGAWRHRSELRGPLASWTAIGATSEHAGIHTVPLGIAMMAGALQARAESASALTSIAWLPQAGLALAWLTTLLCVGRFSLSLILRRWSLRDVDGTWFLVPAALLGTVLATTELPAFAATEWPTASASLLLVAGVVGWCGYWAVAVLAAIRISRHRLRGKPQISWWIAMGCAGLAAATLGGLRNLRAAWSMPWQAVLSMAMTVTIVVALALLVPVLALSAHFLLRHCRFREAAGWPPTFSTAVLAFGCLAAGACLHATPFRLLGWAAGSTTLALWAATMAWNGLAIVRHRR